MEPLHRRDDVTSSLPQETLLTRAGNASSHEPIDAFEKQTPQKLDVSRLLRYAGIGLGLPGAIAQVAYGVKQVKTADEPSKKLNGFTDIVTGLAHGASATVTGLAALAAMTGHATVAQAVEMCAWVYGVSILLDASRDLYNGVQAHQRRDINAGSLKLFSLGILAAGLLRASTSFMVGGTILSDVAIVIQNRDAIGDGVHKAYNGLRRGFNAVAERFGHHQPA